MASEIWDLSSVNKTVWGLLLVMWQYPCDIVICCDIITTFQIVPYWCCVSSKIYLVLLCIPFSSCVISFPYAHYSCHLYCWGIHPTSPSDTCNWCFFTLVLGNRRALSPLFVEGKERHLSSLLTPRCFWSALSFPKHSLPFLSSFLVSLSIPALLHVYMCYMWYQKSTHNFISRICSVLLCFQVKWFFMVSVVFPVDSIVLMRNISF